MGAKRLTQEQKDLQKVRQWLDRLDALLFDVMEVLENGGEKWSVTPDGKLVRVYPHPVIDVRAIKIIRVEYKQNKHFVFPDLLQERLDKLNADIELLRKFKRSNPNCRVKPHKHKDIIARWAGLLNEGMTTEEIAFVYGVSEATVSQYVNRHRKQNQ